MQEDYIMVLVSCPRDEAENIARAVVEERLVACVNILPHISSVYRWQGELTVDEESLLVMKTVDRLYATLEAKIKDIHPYEIPEIICQKIEKGSQSYLNWINESVKRV